MLYQKLKNLDRVQNAFIYAYKKDQESKLPIEAQQMILSTIGKAQISAEATAPPALSAPVLRSNVTVVEEEPVNEEKMQQRMEPHA